MQSNFYSPPKTNAGSTRLFKDEQYSLRGLNMVIPDQIIEGGGNLKGQSPYTINSRMFSREDGEDRTAVRTRTGTSLVADLSGSLDTPIDIENDAVVTGELMFSSSQEVCSPMTVPNYTPLSLGKYALTELNLSLRKTSGYIEYVSVEIYTSSSGLPGTLLAESSFPIQSITSSFLTQKAFFMDAPEVDPEDELVMRLKLVGSDDAQCFVQTTDGSGAYTHDLTTDGSPWVAANCLISFSSEAHRSGAVLGAHRRTVLGEDPETLIYTGYGELLSFDDLGNSTLVKDLAPTVFNDFSARAYMWTIDDRTVVVNRNVQPFYYDGTTTVDLTGWMDGAEGLMFWKNRFFIRKGNRIEFTEIVDSLSDIETIPAVNYFYVSTPDSTDVITGWCLFQDSLYVFTENTKYQVLIFGGGISTLTVREVEGTKGALSQECIATDSNFIYFIADDKQMYRFNGVNDGNTPLSDRIQPEIQAAQLPELYSSIKIHNGEVKYYYAKSPSTTPDRTAIFDTHYEEWFLDTGKPISMAITYNLEDDRLIELSSKAPILFQAGVGGSDCGKPIDFKYWTAYKSYGSGASKKRVRLFRPMFKVGRRRFYMWIGKDVDFSNRPVMKKYQISGGGASWGDFSWGDGTVWGGRTFIDKKAVMTGRGKHNQYRFEKRGVDTPVQLYGYLALYNSGRDR